MEHTITNMLRITYFALATDLVMYDLLIVQGSTATDLNLHIYQ